MGYPKQRLWTDEETAYLKKYYPTMTSKEIGKKFGRNPSTIRVIAMQLGIKTIIFKRRNSWFKKEIEILYKYFPYMSAKEIHNNFLQNRSPISIRGKAKRLKIRPIIHRGQFKEGHSVPKEWRKKVKEYNKNNPNKGTFKKNHLVPEEWVEKVKKTISLWSKEKKEAMKKKRSLQAYLRKPVWSNTLIERNMKSILLKIGFVEGKDFFYDKWIRTVDGSKRPDFLFPNVCLSPNKKLIIECDGFWHSHSCENIIKDIERDKELEASGYDVLHFDDIHLTKNLDEVEEILRAVFNK